MLIGSLLENDKYITIRPFLGHFPFFFSSLVYKIYVKIHVSKVNVFFTFFYTGLRKKGVKKAYRFGEKKKVTSQAKPYRFTSQVITFFRGGVWGKTKKKLCSWTETKKLAQKKVACIGLYRFLAMIA